MIPPGLSSDLEVIRGSTAGWGRRQRGLAGTWQRYPGEAMSPSPSSALLAAASCPEEG